MVDGYPNERTAASLHFLRSDPLSKDRTSKRIHGELVWVIQSGSVLLGSGAHALANKACVRLKEAYFKSC